VESTVAGVSAIIVSYNSRHDLVGCLEALRGQSGLAEVIVVDNASADGSVAMVREEFPETRVIESGSNLGFGGAANLGASAARGDVLLILNPDLRVGTGAVAALRDEVRRTGGVAGPVVEIGGTGELQFGTEMDWLGMPKERRSPGPFFYVQGCALAVDRVLFALLGGFDERYFLFVEDVELCWRARLTGADVSVVETARATHSGGGTVGGGYVRVTGRTSSDLRFSLRERNTVAMFVACAPVTWLVVFALAHLAKITATATVVLALGRPRLAGSLVTGLVWNVRELDGSLARRRSLPPGVSRWAAVRGRVPLRPAALELLARDGLPRFVESTVTS